MTSVSGLLAGGASVFFSALFLGGNADEHSMQFWLACGAWFSTITPAPFVDAIQKQMASLAIVACTELLALLALISGFMPINLPVIGAIFAFKWALAGIAHGVFLFLHGIRWTNPHSSSYRTQLAITAFPLMLTSIVSSLPIAGSVILVRRVYGVESASVTGLAAQVATAYLLIAGVAFRHVQPQLRNADDLRDPVRRRYVLNVAWLLVGIWLATMLAVWGLVHWGLPPIYREHLEVIAALCVSGLLGAAAYLGWAILLSLDCERSILLSYLGGTVIFLASSGALYRSGPFGIALASCFGTGATVLLMTHFHNRKLLKIRRATVNPTARRWP
jgi:hypothetical protein